MYRFRDADGRVVYVGKAKSLRARLSSYFADPGTLHPRTARMVGTAVGVDWVTTATEVEALQLEYSWIKEYDPRFNVKYRDDKSYPYLAVSVAEDVPRVMVVRGAKRPGVRYFGPYAHAWAIRETVDHLLRVFPARTCSAGVYRRAASSGRPCLLGDIGKCSAPCVGRVSVEEHRRIVEDFCSFMSGSTNAHMRSLERAMREASDALDFERAARLRDDLGALQRVVERNAVVLGDATDADVVAVAEDDLEAAVQIFHVRGGRIRGQRGLVVEKTSDADGGALLGDLLLQFYGAEVDAVPREVLCHLEPDDRPGLEEWLTSRSGRRVAIRVPQRGDRRALMETVVRNAGEALALHKVRRTGDLTARAAALEQVREALGLSDALLRIECIDVSHLAGTDVVAALVVFEDGLPRKAHYRTFGLEGADATDDLTSIAAVVRRRFRNAEGSAPRSSGHGDDEAELAEAEGQRRTRFAYPPALLLVDGGPLQAQAAALAAREAGVEVPVVGIAKRLEELWPADAADPVILPRGSEGLFLLQRIRDEAHRSALAFQQRRRARRARGSALDDIPGIGPARARELLRHFGSVRRLRAATAAELEAVPGVGPAVAARLHAALRAQVPPEPTG